MNPIPPDAGLLVMVHVSDLEAMIKRLYDVDDNLLENKELSQMFYRLCGAIASARDGTASGELVQPQEFKFQLKVENKIKAIKLIRKVFGYSLKEAKDKVEANAVFTLPLHHVDTFKKMAEHDGQPYFMLGPDWPSAL